MTSLADELAAFAETPRERPNPCPVARLLDQVGPDAAAVLAAMIDKPKDDPTRKTSVEIARFMAARGHRLGARDLRNHRGRREGCRCSRVSA